MVRKANLSGGFIALLTRLLSSVALLVILQVFLISCGFNGEDSQTSTASNPPQAPAAVIISFPNSSTAGDPVTLLWTWSGGDVTAVAIERREQVSGSSLSVRNSLSDSDWGDWATIANLDANATGYVDNSANCGRTYEYMVCNVNSARARSCAEPQQADMPLCPPRDLTATVAGLSQIDLQWTDNSVGEDSFEVYRKTAPSGQYAVIATVGADVTNYSDTGVACNQKFLYKVRAISPGRDSGYSNEASVDLEACPACMDGVDNDGEGYIDWPSDPGCAYATDLSEYGTNQCDDGTDNDGEVYIDWPSDSKCVSIVDVNESDVWYVNDTATGAQTGLSWADAFIKVQDGVDAATAGETVWVAEGEYISGTTAPVLVMKAGVDVYGGFVGVETSLSQRSDPSIYPSTLDGANLSYHVVSGASGAVFDGFYITGGYANGAGYDRNGAGMFNSGLNNLVVQNCTFYNNYAENSGGAIINVNSSISVVNGIFADNYAVTHGGGIKNNYSTPIITNCVFSGNRAGINGGGVHNHYSTPVIAGCSFVNNQARDFAGGIDNFASSSQISDSVFTNNTAGIGGGAVSSGTDTSVSVIYYLTNCLLTGNTAALGGAIFSWLSTPNISNCTIAANTATNKGGALFNDGPSYSIIKNSIIWGNTAPTSPEIRNQWGSVTVSYSDVRLGYVGIGNINLNPIFISGSDGNYYLSNVSAGQGANSPCIDTGDPVSSPPDGTTSTSGAPDTGVVDMGYHYQIP